MYVMYYIHTCVYIHVHVRVCTCTTVIQRYVKFQYYLVFKFLEGIQLYMYTSYIL